MEAAPDAEVQRDFVYKAGAFIKREIKVGIRLSDHTLIFLHCTAGDVFGDEVHSQVTGDSRLRSRFNHCFRVRSRVKRGRQDEAGQRKASAEGEVFD